MKILSLKELQMYKRYICWWKLWSYRHENICGKISKRFTWKCIAFLCLWFYHSLCSPATHPIAGEDCDATWLRYHVRLILIKKMPLWDQGLQSPLPTNSKSPVQCQTGRINKISQRFKPARFLVIIKLIWIHNLTDGLPGVLPKFLSD